MPAFLTNLLDPAASVDLPPGPAAAALRLDNRELDKLVAALGRSRATWRRALMLHEWLLAAGHALEQGPTHLASPPLDRYKRPYEGTDNAREAMQGYLDWEFGLVGQLGRDGTHHFTVI